MATNPLFWVHPSKYLIQSMDMVMYMYIDYIYIDLLVGIGHLQYLGCTCRLYQKNVVVFFK